MEENNAETTFTTSIAQIPAIDTIIVDPRAQALSLLDWAEKCSIQSIDDVKKATNDLSIMSGAKKKLEELRKQYVQPLNEEVKIINELFRTVSIPLDEADKITRGKILAFNQKQTEIRAKQEEINRKRMEAAQAEAELSGTGEITEEINLVEVQPEVPKQVYGDLGKAGIRKTWNYRIIDFGLIPDSYKVVNDQAIKGAIRGSKGTINIPGIEAYQEESLSVTTRKWEE